MTTLNFARSTKPIFAPMIGNKVNAIVENLLKTSTAFMFLAMQTRKTKKARSSFVLPNDCNLNSSDNESDLEQEAAEKEPPNESIVVEKALSLKHQSLIKNTAPYFVASFYVANFVQFKNANIPKKTKINAYLKLKHLPTAIFKHYCLGLQEKKEATKIKNISDAIIKKKNFLNTYPI
ncbi:hypothetical protein BpHYR1_005913 [Brachionus plicatilis]|uniref:Uncharacterized protein n=1 Tax=Brachionus plicatilis TaxID=10195 RepID=A0A3M7T3C6_BRAPC|nr:hypothetical protein BpHYR1_005913 [Brachionus plicatilis]